MFVMKKLTKRWAATGLALTLLLSAAPVWAASGTDLMLVEGFR